MVKHDITKVNVRVRMFKLNPSFFTYAIISQINQMNPTKNLLNLPWMHILFYALQKSQ
jgi:hypothetical protein